MCCHQPALPVVVQSLFCSPTRRPLSHDSSRQGSQTLLHPTLVFCKSLSFPTHQTWKTTRELLKHRVTEVPPQVTNSRSLLPVLQRSGQGQDGSRLVILVKTFILASQVSDTTGELVCCQLCYFTDGKLPTKYFAIQQTQPLSQRSISPYPLRGPSHVRGNEWVIKIT